MIVGYPGTRCAAGSEVYAEPITMSWYDPELGIDPGQRFCFPAAECYDEFPDSLSVTVSGENFGPLSGQTLTLNRIGTNWASYEACWNTPLPLTLEFPYYSVKIGVNLLTAPNAVVDCGRLPAIINVALIGSPYCQTFGGWVPVYRLGAPPGGGNTQVQAREGTIFYNGTAACPVAFTAGAEYLVGYEADGITPIYGVHQGTVSE